MPELPDIVVYIEALSRTIGDRIVGDVQLRSPFVVRSFEPDLREIIGKRVLGFRRLAKRIVWELQDDLFIVFHLMIAGRFHWRQPESVPRSKRDLVAFHFDNGTLMLTEVSSKKRASVHVCRGAASLAAHRRAGVEILDCEFKQFEQVLLSENHTLKRALTDQRLFSGIGNAYSDEILHAAKLSPVKWTSRLVEAERQRLFVAAQSTLNEWTCRFA